MSARRFEATCRAPQHAGGGTEAERKANWAHLELHGFEAGSVVAFDDRAAFVAHCKAAGIDGTLDRTDPATGLKQRPTYRPIKPWRPPSPRPFDPALGEVGSWVRWQPVRYEATHPDGSWSGRHVPDGPELTGQVWSTVRGGRDPRVIVADGRNWHELAVCELRPVAEPCEQRELVLT